MRHKFYKKLMFLLISIRTWRNIIMNFVTDLSSSVKYFNEMYDVIWMMIDCFTKMTHYISVYKTINASTLTELFIQKIICLHELSNLIVLNCEIMFTSKFWFFFCSYLNIQRKLSTAFYSQTDRQTEHQNQTIKVYL